MAMGFILAGVPAMGKELHASPGQAGAIVGIYLLGMSFGQLLYGPASDRIGRKPPIIAGALIYLVASVICATATSPIVLVAARLMQGMGSCAGQVVSRSVVRDKFDQTETARMFSMMAMITGLVPLIAPAVGGILFEYSGWRTHFWVLTVLGALVCTAATLWLKETRSEATAIHARGEHPIRSYLTLFKQRRLVGYGLAGALNSSAFFTYVANSPDLMINTYKIPPQDFGYIFGANALGMIGAGFINRQMLKRGRPDQMLSIASRVCAALGGLIVVAAFTGFGGAWGILGCLFLIVSSFAFVSSNSMAGALSVDPKRSGSISGLLGALSFLAGSVVSSIAGAFHDGTARPLAITMCVSMVLSSITLHALALPRKEKAAA
jgi:DHA1 family bicyclomycin/chloramphenicol resistance-like MFS transporter